MTLYHIPRAILRRHEPESTMPDDICAGCGYTRDEHWIADRKVTCEELRDLKRRRAREAQRSERLAAIADLLAIEDWQESYGIDLALPLSPLNQRIYGRVAAEAAGLANDMVVAVAQQQAATAAYAEFETLMASWRSCEGTPERRRQWIAEAMGRWLGVFRQSVRQRNLPPQHPAYTRAMNVLAANDEVGE